MPSWELLLRRSLLNPHTFSLAVSSGTGSSPPVAHGFLSRMKMGLYQCFERSSLRANRISLFTCRYQSKIKHWTLSMSTSLISRITWFQRRYTYILCFKLIILTSCRQSWTIISEILLSISATSTSWKPVLSIPISPVSTTVCQTCTSNLTAHDFLFEPKPSNQNVHHIQNHLFHLPYLGSHWPSNAYQKLPWTLLLPPQHPSLAP